MLHQGTILFCHLCKHLARQGGKDILGRNLPEERLNAGETKGSSQSEFGSISPDGVGQLRTSANEPLPHADKHEGCLLLNRLDWHKTHGWTAHRLTEGLGICRIILAAPDVRFDKLWRHQPHFVAERAKGSGPVMGGPTGFNANHCRRQFLEKPDHLMSAQFPA
ncbi:hypothetical protein KRIGEM_03466 [Komagataeibacter rhaeticus]|nr:hypothetical protein KRIGEM_03550 [Komagataeibacter rhaeticus]SAY46677.1 hypothetical protein KRIGEM_03476 [Komagataeibacter rhaeticus]SAY46723.1 hypothetical protein KRIGEM_03522 [Komagataeibacter rhaeticus]SAY46968.1 hypothetical protein KRIGEM_03466 [Komagataeibacter rhaeticus]